MYGGEWKGDGDYRRPGPGWEVDPPLTVLDLIRFGTLDSPLAALLWLALERKLSVISAAGPRLAGKTTLLVALRDLAPPWLDVVYTRGQHEDLSFLGETDPARASIWANELSDHLPWYIWGEPVRRVFDALERGYSLVATLHADTPAEVFDYLGGYPLYIPPRALARLGVIVNLAFFEEQGGWTRRVCAASLVTGRLGRDGMPECVELAAWSPSEGRFRHTLEEALGDLATRLRLSPDTVRAELARRGKLLHVLSTHRGVDGVALRDVVRAYYEEEQGTRSKEQGPAPRLLRLVDDT